MGKFGQQFGLQSPSKSQKSNAKLKTNPIKVTYISTPVKVKATNASEFRAIVQELTGKNSYIGDHSFDDRVATELPLRQDETKHATGNRQVDDQLTRIGGATPADAYNLSGDHAFTNHLPWFEFDEGF